jgi:hypothetical protein
LRRNDYCWKAWSGLDAYHTELTLKPEAGKIQFMSFQNSDISVEDAKALQEGYPKYKAWVGANHPDDWKKVIVPATAGLSGRQLGELESSLCKAYLEATKK